MGGKPAAFVGRPTQHIVPLTGPGSPDVLVHGSPAWMATAPHVCALHGPEAVVAGSETVLINGMLAARAGDYLLGSGPPNRIMEMPGFDDVLIGTPAIGILAQQNRQDFCQQYCALKQDWPNLSPEEREQRYLDILADSFGRFGAPPPGVSETAPPGANAAWDANQWQVLVPPGAWNAQQPPPAGTTYHEVAHAEQTFMGMRARGGDAGAQSDSVPDHAQSAAAAQPLDPDSPEGRYGQVHAANELDEAGLDNRSRIIRSYGDAWRQNPDPSDPAVQAAAHEYYLQPGGQGGGEAANAVGDCGCP